MVTVSEEIKQIVMASPFLEEGIIKGIINLSALAREIKPGIEKRLMKPLSDSAVLMALKRYADRLEDTRLFRSQNAQRIGDISVRSNLLELTFHVSDRIFKKMKNLILDLENNRENFLTFTQGIHELTIICGKDIEGQIERAFAGEKLKTKLADLSSIIIKLPPETVNLPGVHYGILKQLAWRNINVIEVVSTFTEFIVILSRQDIDFAFSTLLNYLSPVDKNR